MAHVRRVALEAFSVLQHPHHLAQESGVKGLAGLAQRGAEAVWRKGLSRLQQACDGKECIFQGRSQSQAIPVTVPSHRQNCK